MEGKPGPPPATARGAISRKGGKIGGKKPHNIITITLNVQRGPAHPGNNFAQLCTLVRPACPQGAPAVPCAPRPGVLRAAPARRGAGPAGARRPTGAGSGSLLQGAGRSPACVCVSPGTPSLGTRSPPSPTATPMPRELPSSPRPVRQPLRPERDRGAPAQPRLPAAGGPAGSPHLGITRCEAGSGGSPAHPAPPPARGWGPSTAPHRRHQPKPHLPASPASCGAGGTHTREFRSAESFPGAPPAPGIRSAARRRSYLRGGPGGGGTLRRAAGLSAAPGSRGPPPSLGRDCRRGPGP